MTWFFRTVLKIAVISLSIILAFGFLDRQFPAADSFSHFRLHFLVLLVAVAFGLAMFRAWRWVVPIFLVVPVIALHAVNLELQEFHTVPAGQNLRLVQFNSLFKNLKPDFSADWILQQKPDLVTLQEVSKQSGVIIDALKPQLAYSAVCKFATVGGVAVVSRYPIVQSGCIQGQGLVWIQVSIEGKLLTVASLHLHWPWPYRQWQQIERLAPAFASMPRPIVLAGDFNAAPWSGAVQKVADATDTRVVDGLRPTLRMGPPPVGPIALLPIDHVLISEIFHVRSMKRGPAIGSDHHPVVADLVWK
jgi:endonuclease/exonuclease/phosphatase (EEP) superfamily protein YafD